MNKRVYYAAVYSDGDGGFLARFPDFPEMAADYGHNFNDCVEQCTNFLVDVVAYMIENNQELPKASSGDVAIAKLDPQDGEVMCLVPVVIYPPAPTKRINITGKEDVFARIDDYAKAHHITRSELMINATLEYMRVN